MNETHPFSNPVKSKQLFMGDEKKSFLAPRGVCIGKEKLIVSDTGQNRIFIWNTIPQERYKSPDVIIGQSDSIETKRNNGNIVNASTLQYPSGIWTDGTKLIVADAWNHRVLIWHTFPIRHFQPADVVVGQPSFRTNQPNVKGLGVPPSSQSLYWCYGVWVHNNELWIADTGNRRILWYKTIPIENFAPADKLIGASTFNEKNYDHHHAIWPYSIKINSENKLAITDTQYFRVLLWHNAHQAFSKTCDSIIGQPDIDSSGQNQYRLKPQANTLSWCYDSCFYKEGIWVADTGNSRLLGFNELPTINNESAQTLIGHDNFETGSENLTTILTTENSLYWPFSMSINNNTLAVADTGNHRIVLYQLS